MHNFYVYLAGGMSGLSFTEQNDYRRKIKNSLEHEEGNIYSCVVWNPVDYFNFETITHDNEYEVMEFDLNKVRKADLIIVNFNSPNSIGTAMELAIAYEKRIPIIGLNEKNVELHPWLVEVTNRMFSDLEELLYYVKVYYLV